MARDNYPSSIASAKRFKIGPVNNRVAVSLLAAVLGLLILVGGGALLLSSPSANKTNDTRGIDFAKYGAGSLSLSGLKQDSLLMGQANHVAINGQLIVNDGLVITPTAEPKTAVLGQLYFDQTLNKPFYYDGKNFVSLVPTTPVTVSSIGGASGLVGLGNGLQISGGQLRLTDAILQAVAAVGATGGVVSSVQGQTGAVSFTGSAGIDVNGTKFTNTGLLSLGGAAGNVGWAAA